MSYTTKVTSKGTITITADLRKQLGIKAGQLLTLNASKDGILVKPITTLEDVDSTLKVIARKIPKGLRNISEQELEKRTIDEKKQAWQKS